MQVQFSYNKRQVLQGLRYHFILKKEIRLLIIFINVFTILSAVLYFLKKISPFAFMLGAVIWLFALIMFWFVLPNMIYNRNFTFKDHFICELNDQHFLLENSRGNRSWAWREFSNWIESPAFFHLYFDSRSFFLLPKDAFDNAELLLEARKLLSANIAKS